MARRRLSNRSGRCGRARARRWRSTSIRPGDQLLLAAHGVYLENSAAAALTALRQLKARGGSALLRAVLIETSSGYKGL